MGPFHGMDSPVEASGSQEQYYMNGLILWNRPPIEASGGQEQYYVNGPPMEASGWSFIEKTCVMQDPNPK